MKQNFIQHVSYYDVLHVQKDANDEEIKRAYHRLAKRFHPDRNPANRRMSEYQFRLINEAYSMLKTREKRIRYNRTLRAQNDNVPQPSVIKYLANLLWPSKST